MEIIALEKPSSKKKKGMRPVCGLPSGLPTFDSYRRRFSVARRVSNESSMHSPPNPDEAVHSQAAISSKDMNPYSRELTSILPSHKHDFKDATKTYTRDKLTCSDAHTPTCLQLDECMNFRQLRIHEDCELKEGNPLSALLNGSSSPLAKCNNAQKLAWLKSQLIGENQEFVTPFDKRRLVYADHTASGRSLIFIEDFIAQNLLPFYGNTHTDDSYVGRRTSRMMKQAEEYIKEKLGGSKDDVLLMCGWGCTAAIKRLQEVMGITVPSTLRAQVLDTMQGARSKEDERWLVFTGPYEHHSNLLSWRQSLAEVVEIPANEKGEIDMGKLEAALRAAEASGRKNKIGSFSACSNVTGVLSDTRTIARLLHKYGAFACFDFAAGAPHFQIEMRSRQEDGYDAIMLSPHKLLGGPGTPGLLLMRKRLYKLENQPPSTCGGGTVAYVNGFSEKDTLYYERIEEREEGGTPAIVGKVRCALAFWLKEAMGRAMIEQRETLYMNKAITRLSSHPNIEILGGLPSSTRAPILSLLIYPHDGPLNNLMLDQQGGLQKNGFKKPLHGRFVVKLLNDLFGIQARGGCSCAGPYGHMLLGVSQDISLTIRSAIKLGYEGLKPGWARISLCYSMTDEEVDYIISAIELLADYGQRFLALYDFDCRTGNWTYIAHGDALCNKTKEELQIGNRVTIPKENNQQMWGEWRELRQFLRFAETLSHLLPKCPLPKLIPKAVDPDLLLFCV